MFSWLRKNPSKKLQKDYEATLEKAMHAQRRGDIKTYSLLTEQAEKIRAEIDAASSTSA
ncbi:DUF6435 family protein [Gilvimarinus sp. DA14]|uniref:DUF6435 family protein n=1 Tax=Gilvimarinus sp. DA14 TaxID=2956798 RepID=UPI0020B85C1F|nr:DUF6435 family protein [Gilvimarinus sp. DA14]UTF60215.1 DUF6435 family protein [Gilvimarinus sp. DA14]